MALPRTASPVDQAEIQAPRRHLGPAWHRRIGGLHVLKLKGTHYEMGRQHGALLASVIPDGPLPYFRQHVEKLAARSLPGPLRRLALPALRQLLGRQVARGLPSYARDTIRGLAEGAGLKEQAVLDACTMPDSLLWVVARLIRLRAPGPAVWHRLSLGLGCTSAIAWGAATTDGRLLHARNFDYHGVASWPRTAAILFHEPDEGQRYVSIAAAGVGMGGVTAMNQAGLSLTVHQHMFTTQTRLGGTPIGVVGDEVMRRARSLDEAEAILRGQRPIGCWTYLVTDGARGEVLCFEENPERQAARRLGPGEGTLGYANIYLDPELGATEENLYGSYWRHNHGRHRRANQLLQAGRGRLDAQAMAGIIGHPGDPRCRVRDSIAMVMTTGSVVFRPEDGALWVGTGEAPTSRGTYLPFSLADQDFAPQLGELTVGGDGDRRGDDGFERYRRAYVAWLDDEDPRAALGHLDEARTLCPDQALYHAVAGIIALVLGDGAAAEARFDQALALGHPDEERVAAWHLFRGRARDLLARRREAIADYRAALGRHADAPVHRAARRDLGRPYTAARARRLDLDMSLGDCIAP